MTKLNLPATIEVDFQPHGLVTLGELSEFAYHTTCNGAQITYRGIVGTVLKGSETSRLFQFSSTKDISGQRCHVYGAKQSEIDAGRIVRVAM